MAATNKLREELAQKFLEALNQGHIPWQACWAQGRPENAVTGKTYRGVNAFALSYAADDRGYTDPRWCTYRQAQEKGWQVRKGEKSAHVEYWAYYDLEEKKLLSWPEVRDKLKADPDYEKHLQLRCRVYSVFNAHQIDGIPALEERPQTDIGALRAHRDTLVRNMGIGYDEYGSRAFYRPSTDTVILPPEASFDDTYSYMATFLHECGHATGAAHRLNRDLSGFNGSESYAREELRAEIASAFTAQSLGLQLTPAQLAHHTQLHAAYVQSWATILKDAPGELFRAIKSAEGISDYLIEKGEFDLEHTEQKTHPKEWCIVYKNGDTWAGELEIVPAEELQGREVIETFHCADRQEATEKLDRYEELQRCFWYETDDPETQEWRDDLTADEAAMVEQWDAQTAQGFSKLAKAILEKSVDNEQTVITTKAQAKAIAESIPYAQLVDYDTLVHEAGKNLTSKYTLEGIPDSPDLRLRFHGYGKIQDYFSVEARPWQAQIGRIREIVIENGITEIGRNVLNDYPTVEKVTWPRSIARSDPYALWNCPNLKEISFSGTPQRSLESQDLPSPHILLTLANRYPELTREQLTEIAEDLRDGASWDEISVYAKPEFSAQQMNAIRYAARNGLTPDQVGLIADPHFTPVQMDILRCSFLAGMNMDQVQRFAHAELPAYQMLDAHLATQNGQHWKPPVASQLSDEEATLQHIADIAEKEFQEMNAFLNHGGDIAELADLYEPDLDFGP